jgi:D-alanyl-lipoteichoic acid acyltransferase DltB (MBOAT superfamily)
MSFITPEFVILFCTVIPAFFLLPHRWRWLWLLLVSYFFYAYGNIQYLPLIVFSTVVDYTAGRMIHHYDDNERARKGWLLASIGVNLGVLFFFKYFNFFNVSAGTLFGYEPVTHEYVLPIGISFYTFQSMSYTIDVYRRKLIPEPNAGIMATFVAFFPQLVAGPIERATNLLPQFHRKQVFDVDRTVSGLQQILWGFFKKVVIADRVAIYVNTVYGDVNEYTGLPLLLATFFFGFQIYCDFSAYSDIAIGTARIMGFDIMENFRQPFFSQSVREFWNRWHISLSTWFRDYLYIPLGGSRVSLPRQLINLMIVFLVSGLWHGAGWTFVLWGGLHGLGVCWSAITRARNIQLLPDKSKLAIIIRVLCTFAFITLTWVFFRANSFADTLYILQHLFDFSWQGNIMAPFEQGLLGIETEFYLSFALIAFLLLGDAFEARYGLERGLAKTPAVLRWGWYYAAAAAVIFSGIYGAGAQQFIYFQF